MSRLRFRHLRLRTETGRGRFGADIPIGDGLMVLWADNSRGKSTAVQSLLFALGLERMITARPIHAVTSAMRERLIYDVTTKRETPVLSSWVTVEIEGKDGKIATVTRWIKHEQMSPSLVRVVEGPAISAPGSYNSQDLYVGRPGAAANPRGFHRWLASFIGWEMPELPGTDGRMSRLYMEQVFPLLFVEQRRGWGGIQAQMPYFSGVTDVRLRSIEFLLNLDVGKMEAERLRLRAQETKLQEAWRSAVRAFKEILRGSGLITFQLPETLTVAWPPQETPSLAESRDSGWVPMTDVLRELEEEHRQLTEAVVPRVADIEPETEHRLAEALNNLDELREAGSYIRDDILRDRTEFHSLENRLDALKEDLRQHQDILTLQRLGSDEIGRLHGDCPVCHQQLPESLVGAPSPVRTLSPEDTVSYIKQQIELFHIMARDAEITLNAKEERWAAIHGRTAELNSLVRALRATLGAPRGTPSIEIITRQVQLRERIDRLHSINERFLELIGELTRIADDARLIRTAMKDLPADRLSDADREKLSGLERSFVQQLHAYDFGSFSDERLRISDVDYLPRRDDFDIQADISASDSIRVIWAYLLGLLEVSNRMETNHLGLLILDEPRQQSAKEISFRALLDRASRDAEGRQVVFATSEALSSLRGMLSDIPHHLHVIDGYVLKPVSE
ncbi:hypothetical protein [Microtetraspora malaysiensis]|uniref:hypothetical protein n=1 Tax=Microtetraspora malaysiensis TaxID=161358 RepID=UPI000AB56EF3|nr:hypothetical protein [Microtetraspora malaysiensis]